MTTKKKETKSEPVYEVRDIVLAKLRGYPPWPAMVVDPENLPKTVKKERPRATKTRFYCVRFFPAGDHAWFVAKDLSKLQKHEIEAYIADPSKKNGDLLMGFKIALNPTEWEERLAEARQEQEAVDEQAEIDQLGEDGEGGTMKGKGKKRKRDSEPGTDKKSSTSKKAKAEPARKRATKGEGKATKKTGKKGQKGKSSEMIESEDEGAEEEDAEGEGDEEETSAPPPTKKAKKDKDDDEEDSPLNHDPEARRVKDWRHKLQRAFLREGNPPLEKEMPEHDKTFKTVEAYEGLTIEYLQYSKIGKVMRKIASLAASSIPRDDEFKFKERANALVAKWKKLASSPTAGQGGTITAEPSTATVKAEDSAVADSTATQDAPAGDGEGMDVDHVASQINGSKDGDLPMDVTA